MILVTAGILVIVVVFVVLYGLVLSVLSGDRLGPHGDRGRLIGSIPRWEDGGYT